MSSFDSALCQVEKFLFGILQRAGRSEKARSAAERDQVKRFWRKGVSLAEWRGGRLGRIRERAKSAHGPWGS